MTAMIPINFINIKTTLFHSGPAFGLLLAMPEPNHYKTYNFTLLLTHVQFFVSF